VSSTWGEQIKISVFGESHGAAVGVVIDGLPPGIPVDTGKIRREMARRRPGLDKYSTARNEEDEVEIVSGFFNGYTTGTPLCGIIRNTDKRSADYEGIKNIMRPGHADFTGRIRYRGFGDYRGGGHFSGRLTAPVVFAGAIASQFLEQEKTVIGTHILRIGGAQDTPADMANISETQLKAIRDMRFPVFNTEMADKMKEEIDSARMEQDSVGGLLETVIVNVPAGLGSPIFDSVESRIASFVFSIPAVKGIEFGSGFGFATMRGGDANDSIAIKDNISHYNAIKGQESGSMPPCCTRTNHAGGINGGITNGMPVVFRTVFRPTPSIGKPQQTVDIETMEEKVISVKGRHDPCIAVRAVPVIDAAAALVMMDLLLEWKKYGGC